MPQVPQYQRQVAPQLTPTPYRNDNVNEDMFGANISKAQANFGNALGSFTDALGQVKARMDDTKILGLANYSSEWEQQNLYDKDNGYYYKQGKDAYGLSEGLLKDYDKYMDDYISKSGLSPSAARRAKETVTGFRYRIMQGTTAHDYKQGIAWSNTEADTAKANYINNAVNLRNSPEEISKSLLSGYQIIEWQGEIQHKDEAAIRAEKMQYRSNLHQAVLSSLLGEGSLKASEYLEQHKGEIAPDKLPQYVNAAKSNELNYTARETAKSLLNLSLEDAYSSINSISDPQTREATMREYNVLTNQQEAIQRDKTNKFMSDFSDQLSDALVNGQDPNDLKKSILQSDLPFDVKEKQIQYINDCLELNQEVHLWNETEYIENLKHSDFEAFQKLDLSKFALTKAERQKYLEEQNKVVQYSTESQLRDIVKEFDTFFWAGKDGLDGNVYKDELVGVLARIERLQGEAFDIKQIDEGSLKHLIEGMKYKNDTVANKNIDETKELYMRAKAVGEVQERVARNYVNFKAKNKREPEPEEMFTMVQKVYNDVGRENKARVQQSVNNKTQIYKNINSAQIKKVGYTKALTYFEDSVIPQLERDTGVKMKITSSYRDTTRNKSVGGASGSLHTKGMALDIFPENPTKENIQKTTEWLLTHPAVESILCNNPNVVRYQGNKKLLYKQAVDYEKKNGITHTNHFHITLTSQFGGTEQLKPSMMTAAKQP